MANKEFDEWFKIILRGEKEKNEIRRMEEQITSKLKGLFTREMPLAKDLSITAIGFKMPSDYKQAQKMANDLADRVNKGKKAGLWVCHPLADGEKKRDDMFKVGKCSHCKGRVVYDPAHSTRMLKSAKKVCRICTLKHYRKGLDPEMVKYLERGNN